MTEAQLIRELKSRISNLEAKTACCKVIVVSGNTSDQVVLDDTITKITNWTDLTDSKDVFNSTTGEFTASKTDTFLVSAYITLPAHTSVSEEQSSIAIYVNGASRAVNYYYHPTAATLIPTTMSITAGVQLNKDDVLDIRITHDFDPSLTLTDYNLLTIYEL